MEPSGDVLPEKPMESTYIRIGYQNIHGITWKEGLPTEIEAMEDLGVDIMGMTETNCPWTPQSKAEYDVHMKQVFGTSRTLYGSAPGGTGNYQPGGTLLTINGHTTGRIAQSGTDPWGRFCWYQLRGRRDEGVLIICAYRVCQTTPGHCGPFTAYQQQVSLMRANGITKPNPQKQILSDLLHLIETQRALGFRPILMMDANGDYKTDKATDKELAQFLIDANLIDPFFDKFSLSPPTYAYGKRRIDYIFTDPTCAPAMLRTGYLGSHQGAFSDHSLAFMDLDEKKLFGGVLNRPVHFHSREITLEQDDKVQKYLSLLEDKLREHKVELRIVELAAMFSTYGPTDKNIRKYQRLYKEFIDLARGCAKQVGRKKFGYMRSAELTIRARILLIFKQIYDCKSRKAPMSAALRTRCESMDIPLDTLETHTLQDLRKEVRARRQALWAAQKNCEELRRADLVDKAKDKAKREKIANWESKMQAMIATAELSAVNRKLTMITKGKRGVLDRIQVPTHDWFFSPRYDELYHYVDGVFEAYPSKSGDEFFNHHTLKVLPQDSEPVRVTYDSMSNGWCIVETLPLNEALWEDITAQEEIEAHLLRRNKRHLEQTDREQGISTQQLFRDIRAQDGINPLTADILDGSFQTTYELTPETAAFFEALKITPREGELRPILGIMTSEQFQSMFKAAKEKTSSDPRTLNYSLWKCIARSDYISSFTCILLSLPFVYGFVNEQWTHMTDYMLEKKPGERKIHLLRIIGKVAAEFNTCLKFYIGKQAMYNYEDTDPCDEQHGFRPNRSSVDAAMLKLLTFECSRLTRSTVGMIQHDMAAHFDRMYPEMTSIYASRYGVDENILRSIGGTIRKLRRNVETALGISKEAYSQTEDGPNIGGMVQGKADVPQLSTQQSDALLRAHKKVTHGLRICNPDGTKAIKHHSVVFADDTDQHTNVPSAQRNPIRAVVKRLQHSAQTWNNLINIPGGLLAYHKCNWQLIAWTQKTGYMELVQNCTYDLHISDGKGARARIDYLTPNEPNVGLGFALCPNGNQSPHFDRTFTAIQAICRNMQSAHLTEQEARRLLQQRIKPKLMYALHLSAFTDKQGSKMDTLIRQSFLPRLRLNRHFPAAVLYGPKKMGGLEFLHTRTLQLSTQIAYFVKQLRWDHTVANDLIVTIDTLQLVVGFSQPLFERTAPTVTYVRDSFLLSVRNQLADIDASLWIEDIWKPQLQREHDIFIMDAFVAIPGITAAMLRQANEVRLYLRILTIADITHPDGQYIPDDMLNGEWQAGSDVHWPHQQLPPPKFWATFRRCLRRTFCTRTPARQPASQGMDLDRPLGKWYPVPRNVWFDVYCAGSDIFWRTDDAITRMRQMPGERIYVKDGVVDEVPLHAHPIAHRQVGTKKRFHRAYNITSTLAQDPHPTGYISRNTITSESQHLIIVSDASVRTSTAITTCAWVISHSVAQSLAASARVTNISTNNSYRGELEGIYRALRMTTELDMDSAKLTMWCDNKAAIDKLNTPLETPGSMIQPEADVILATASLARRVQSHDITFKHVYGHQDTRRFQPSRPGANMTIQDHRSHTTPHQPTEVRLNIECDRMANAMARAIESGEDTDTRTIQPPYPGSKALLKIGTVWITADMHGHIHRVRHTPNLTAYCKQKYGWTDDEMATIHWDAIGRARTGQSSTYLMQTSKFMHGWLPVMHMHGHTTGIKQCPGCSCTDETFEHMMRCTHPQMAITRTAALDNLRHNGVQHGLPKPFMTTVVRYIRNTLQGRATDYRDMEIEKVLKSQDRIGANYFIRGFISTEWSNLATNLGNTEPDRCTALLIRSLWDDLITPLWRTRNDILHHSTNFVSDTTYAQLGDRLLWYIQNKSALARQDQYLTQFSASQIDAMGIHQRREWVKHLDIARDAWTKEQAILATGQRLITDYFKRTDTQHEKDLD